MAVQTSVAASNSAVFLSLHSAIEPTTSERYFSSFSAATSARSEGSESGVIPVLSFLMNEVFFLSDASRFFSAERSVLAH